MVLLLFWVLTLQEKAQNYLKIWKKDNQTRIFDFGRFRSYAKTSKISLQKRLRSEVLFYNQVLFQRKQLKFSMPRKHPIVAKNPVTLFRVKGSAVFQCNSTFFWSNNLVSFKHCSTSHFPQVSSTSHSSGVWIIVSMKSYEIPQTSLLCKQTKSQNYYTVYENQVVEVWINLCNCQNHL